MFSTFCQVLFKDFIFRVKNKNRKDYKEKNKTKIKNGKQCYLIAPTINNNNSYKIGNRFTIEN